MIFFKNISSLEELKTQYKTLAKINHPDMGGNTETMQKINEQFDMLFIIWKNASPKINNNSTETAETFKRWFYTENGWEGNRYNSNLSCKEIGKLARTFCKTVYPLCKFSITTKHNTISINLIECNYDVFSNEEDKYNYYYDGTSEYSAYMQLNHYYIDKDKRLTEKAKIMLKNVYEYLNSYNYDDSDAMTDYFDCGFYIHMAIGQWNKPFKIVEKMERIATTETEAKVKSDKFTYKIKEDTDTRDNSKIFIVTSIEKLSKDEYIKVSSLMKSLGGYYSKFKHGFLFREYPNTLFS